MKAFERFHCDRVQAFSSHRRLFTTNCQFGLHHVKDCPNQSLFGRVLLKPQLPVGTPSTPC
jgi:hypothetical protein